MQKVPAKGPCKRSLLKVPAKAQITSPEWKKEKKEKERKEKEKKEKKAENGRQEKTKKRARKKQGKERKKSRRKRARVRLIHPNSWSPAPGGKYWYHTSIYSSAKLCYDFDFTPMIAWYRTVIILDNWCCTSKFHIASRLVFKTSFMFPPSLLPFPSLPRPAPSSPPSLLSANAGLIHNIIILL